MGVLGNLPLLAVSVLAPVYLLAGLAALYLVLPPGTFASPRQRRRGRRARSSRIRLPWGLLVGAAIIMGALLGLALIWFVGDVDDVFGASPTGVDRAWTGAVVAGILVAALSIWKGRWWRRSIACVSVVAFVLAGALAINRDASAYETLSEATGTSHVQALALPTSTPAASTPVTSSPAATIGARARVSTVSNAFDPDLYESWRPPAGMPRSGTVGSITIPATVSHFRARPAIVYLPPAALVKDAPALPVVIMLSGQPGDPNSLLVSGHLSESLDKLASEHRGLAPIVVIPDQLGSTYANPMCVDGRLGNSATYLTTDVPTFITHHFRVAHGARAWAIGGFSQGATCAIQLGSAHPDVFGSFIDVSGELGPTLDSGAEAVREGFAGSAVAYARAQPTSILRARAPYSDFAAFFAVGATDNTYRPAADVNSAAARAAGMTVTLDVIPGSGHDWTTATVGMAEGLAWLFPRVGLAPRVG